MRIGCQRNIGLSTVALVVAGASVAACGGRAGGRDSAAASRTATAARALANGGPVSRGAVAQDSFGASLQSSLEPAAGHKWRNCKSAAGARAFPSAAVGAILGDATADTSVGVLLQRDFHRGDAVRYGPWIAGESTPERTVDTIFIRARPTADATPVARFELVADSANGPCQFVAAATRDDSLYRPTHAKYSDLPLGLPVDSVAADSSWVRARYALDAASPHQVGWAKLGQGGAGLVRWPKLFAYMLKDTTIARVILFRSAPTLDELRLTLRVAPGGAAAPLNLPANFTGADVLMTVLQLRGEWARVRLMRGGECDYRGEALLGTGWVRLVNDRGRTRFKNFPWDDCGD